MTGCQSSAKLVIASRESRLAMWQAHFIQAKLSERYPASEVTILGMTTKGDQILDRPLAEIGGKGLFIKELETALMQGDAHLAVHSMKDVPMALPDGFSLTAIPARETPFDAFVSNRFAKLEDLPANSVVGTSSRRREAILRARYPHLRVQSLRGNLDTRLRKLDEGLYDAIILAAAGLIRLSLAGRIRYVLPPEQFLPAPGQGALGIETLASDLATQSLVMPLTDTPTMNCVLAERAFSRALDGSCQVPLGGYAVIEGSNLWLRGFVALPDGSRMVEGEIRGNVDDGESLGIALANELRQRGADEVLAALSCHARAR